MFKRIAAVGLIAGGLVLGGTTVAHATNDNPYVTVIWSYQGYPDLTAPQPFIAAQPGANLHAFDSLLAGPDWCGKPTQLDIYQRTDAHGLSWESLKETGALQYGHDGGFLAYNAGVGQPYRIITSEEFPCTTPTPSATTPPTSPTPAPSSTPSASPSSPPETSTPEPSSTSTPSPTVKPTPTPVSTPTGTPTPSTAPQPTETATPSPTPSDASSPVSKPASTPTSAPVASPHSPDQLAFTGANPWPGIGAAVVLILVGAGLLIARRVRRG